MSKPILAQLKRRKEALSALAAKRAKLSDEYDEAGRRIAAKYEPKLKELDDYIVSETNALKELEERLKA